MLDAIIQSVHNLGVPLRPCLDIDLGWGSVIGIPSEPNARVQVIGHAVPASLCTHLSNRIRIMISFQYAM